MTIACYLRASTSQQEIHHQRAEIEKWLISNGFDPKKAKWFSDVKGDTASRRPAFDRMQGAIVDGKVRTVVLPSLERLCRPLSEAAIVLAEWCDRGLTVMSVAEHVALDGLKGQVFLAAMKGLLKMEQAYRREQQSVGIKKARKEGVYRGRKIGTTKSRPERVARLRKKGLSVERISQALGISERTVWRYLKK